MGRHADAGQLLLPLAGKQHQFGFGAGNAELDPPLRAVERRIGQHLESQLFGEPGGFAERRSDDDAGEERGGVPDIVD